MSSLGEELQQTIRNIETICDLQKPPSNEVLIKLDVLYALQIDLIDAAIRKSTAEYVNATVSMNEAAKKTQEAIDDLAKLEKAIEKIAAAIGKVDVLLAAVT